MKKIILLFTLGLISLTVSCQNTIQPSGQNVKENREVGAFTGIEAGGFFKVILEKSNKNSVLVDTDAEFAKFIETEVNSNTLKIRVKPNIRLKNNRQNTVTITVYYTKLNEVHFTGSGSLTGKDAIDNNCTISLTGSGSVALNVNTDTVKVSVTGSGSVDVSGKSNTLKCDLTGSGSFKGSSLKSTNADLSVTGSGSIKATASAFVKGRIMGSGSISYGGNPEKKDLSTTGSGKISTY
ncbi:MAG: head GIN domain-containing protein [Bacteroidia bacterium]